MRQSVFDAGADVESAATFDGEANFYDLAKFIGGETDFNATVESSGGTAAQFTEADSQDLADFHAELEIVGIGCCRRRVRRNEREYSIQFCG